MNAHVYISVSAKVERSNKGKRVRVRAEDGRAVRCCNAWRSTLLGAGLVRVLALDMGTHWNVPAQGVAHAHIR